MDTPASISRELYKLAKEVEDTAIGSSRIEMYRSIADRLKEQARAVEDLTVVSSPSRAFDHSTR